MHKPDCIRFLNCRIYYEDLDPKVEFDCSMCKMYHKNFCKKGNTETQTNL